MFCVYFATLFCILYILYFKESRKRFANKTLKRKLEEMTLMFFICVGNVMAYVAVVTGPCVNKSFKD